MLNLAAERNRFLVQKLSPEEWKKLSEKAHLVVFNEERPADFDRIDFALTCEEGGVLCGYLTARELDKNSLYWQFGGAFPGTAESFKTFECYRQFMEWTMDRYERITTLVENTNVRYLKLAMHMGFRIIGCRFFKGEILVELLKERGD